MTQSDRSLFTREVWQEPGARLMRVRYYELSHLTIEEMEGGLRKIVYRPPGSHEQAIIMGPEEGSYG